ncbi:MAG: hypothetical protein LBB91_01750 [Clostridiales bacterium]|jgi:hypothetical protein|nr:hypothetical protein [Clostridiales bacterium]
MLKSLLSQKTDFAFAAAVDAVKQSYLTGTYTANGQGIPLPFRRSFQELFVKKAGKVYTDDKPCENWWVYNHIGNVVAAMAHLLHYVESHIDMILPQDETDVDRVFSSQRKLDNLHLAYYHDIGKCIISRRHAIEGKLLFAGPKASVRYRFEQIFKAYEADSVKLCAETIPYYTELIGAHDVFGTIGTGENGLLSLSGIISSLAALYAKKPQNLKNAVFDLWLLNVADIIVSVNSVNGKAVIKSETLYWCERLPGTLDEDIGWFFASPSGKYLKEDLEFALDIADIAVQAKVDVYDYSKHLSDEQVAHRIGRLAQQSLGGVLEDPKNDLLPNAPELKNEIIARLEPEGIFGEIQRILSSKFGNGYPKLFGTMLQFDYALGFFQKLAISALKRINEELSGGQFRTGWLLHLKKPEGTDHYKKDGFMIRYNAECIVNNYLTVLSGIFGEISRLTAGIEKWNIDFEDAGKHLNESKAEQLLFLEGTYRADSARSLLMREIMLYKANG